MSAPLIIETDLSFVTPTFLGDAYHKPEIRPQSFKGAIRFWYRAIDAKLLKEKEREDYIWGGAGDNYGQSKVLLRTVVSKNPSTRIWNKNDFSSYTVGRGHNSPNGILYFGYPFALGKNRNNIKYLVPGTSFKLQAIIPNISSVTEEEFKAIVSSLWFFFALGSCGSRSRRGFGSIQATSWKLLNCNNPKLKEIFDSLTYVNNSVSAPIDITTPDDWLYSIELTYLQIKDWFGEFPDNTAHPHIPNNFQVKILEGFPSWEGALNDAGLRMQKFRRGYGYDYQIVKELVIRPVHGKNAPDRVTFGVPLSFIGKNINFLIDLNLPNERFASLLFIKIVKLGDLYHPVVFKLEGDMPGFDLPLMARVRANLIRLKPPQKNAMSEFFDSLRGIL